MKPKLNEISLLKNAHCSLCGYPVIKKLIKSPKIFSEHKPFDWKEQLEINRQVVFPSRFCEDACTLIIKQQEEIKELRYRLTNVDCDKLNMLAT